ncbi:hypothetical protein D3C75_1276950 [compost metagenome]
MRGHVQVLSITPIGHNRIVYLIDDETGKQRMITYGDSVTEAVIRRRAPLLWRIARPIKDKGAASNDTLSKS